MVWDLHAIVIMNVLWQVMGSQAHLPIVGSCQPQGNRYTFACLATTAPYVQVVGIGACLIANNNLTDDEDEPCKVFNGIPRYEMLCSYQQSTFDDGVMFLH